MISFFMGVTSSLDHNFKEWLSSVSARQDKPAGTGIGMRASKDRRGHPGYEKYLKFRRAGRPNLGESSACRRLSGALVSGARAVCAARSLDWRDRSGNLAGKASHLSPDKPQPRPLHA
ncbi:hypothetical protein [Pararhizobium polonicum]|uniref:hypothetical protein n=1 Tax=Pararhizobium polonicum TaxID=1612624 RepID=UPI0011119EDA|nr:hypothetical protein [Pararhizobium polonicum]